MQNNYDDFARHFLENPNDKLLLDVRNDDEVIHGMLPGALHIPLPELHSRFSELAVHKTIYIYCRSGMRAAAACEILIQHGWREVFSASNGGYDNLKLLIKEKGL